MSKTYARITEGGIVAELFVVNPLAEDVVQRGETLHSEGDTPDISWYFPSTDLQWVDVSEVTPRPSENWVYKSGEFTSSEIDVRDIGETKILNEQRKFMSLQLATSAMTPLLISLQLGNATDIETSKAIEWQEYYRQLQLVDAGQVDPVWPVSPS